MQYPKVLTPTKNQARIITLISPSEALRATPCATFTPGRCAVRIGPDAWVGDARQISKYVIAMDTANGLAVFDLREVQLLRLIE